MGFGKKTVDTQAEYSFWELQHFPRSGNAYFSKTLEDHISGTKKLFSHNFSSIFSKLVPAFKKMFQINAESLIDVRFKFC